MALDETMADNVLRGYDGDVFKRKDGEPTGLNLQFFAGLAASKLSVKFVAEVECFYVFDHSTSVWTPATTTQMHKLLRELLCAYRDLKHLTGMDRLITPGILSNLLTLLRMEVETAGFFNRDVDHALPVIHAENGFLRPDADKSCWQLAEADDAAVQTHHSRHRLNAAFDPAAECPEFLRFLQEAGLRQDDQSVLQAYMGQALLGLNRDHSILLVNGGGGSSHLQLLSLIRRIIGEEAIAFLPHAASGIKHFYQHVLGRQLVIGTNVATDFLMTQGRETVVALTSGDPIRMETRGSNSTFSIDGVFPVILFSNQRLQLKLNGDRETWRRRLLSITFADTNDKKSQKNCQQAVELLQKERSGILNWLLAGALEVLKNDGQISRSPAQMRAVDDILDEAESVHIFCNEMLTKADSSNTVSCQELQTAYVSYCLDRGWVPLSRHQAGGLLNQTIYRLFRLPQATDITRDGTNKRGYRQLQLGKNTPPYQPPQQQKEAENETN